jgi:hypothetical protein
MNDRDLGVLSIPAPSALAATPFPAEHVVPGATGQAQFLHTLRGAPVVGFSIEELGWETAPKAPVAVKLRGVKDLDWHLEPDELEP